MRPSAFMTGTAFGRPLARLGLASPEASALTPDDVLRAVEAGVRFLSWRPTSVRPGEVDVLREAIAALGSRRRDVFVSLAFAARTAAEARRELDVVLPVLGGELDLALLERVEPDEWEPLRGSGGAFVLLRETPTVRRVGLSSHHRLAAAAWAQTGELDALAIRYNALHRGAEREVFPVTAPLGLPVIAFSALAAGALVEPGVCATKWYRFVLQHPAVAVTVAAPRTRKELDATLGLLGVGPLAPEELEALQLTPNRRPPS